MKYTIAGAATPSAAARANSAPGVFLRAPASICPANAALQALVLCQARHRQWSQALQVPLLCRAGPRPQPPAGESGSGVGARLSVAADSRPSDSALESRPVSSMSVRLSPFRSARDSRPACSWRREQRHQARPAARQVHAPREAPASGGGKG